MACIFSTTAPQNQRRTDGRPQANSLYATPSEDYPEQLLKIVSYYAASVTLLIGMSMMLVWHSYNAELYESTPILYQMKFNTAAGMTLGAFSLMATTFGSVFYARASALLLLLLGGSAVLEYASGIDFGIDNIFVDDNWSTQVAHPGRMAPNTAACFCILSTVLLMAHSRIGVEIRLLVMKVLTFIVMAIGLAALGGYFAAIDIVYNWGSYAQMSPHTAISFLSLAVGIAAHIRLQEKSRQLNIPLWIPTLLCFFVVWFDLSTPLGVAAGVAYIPLIFCSLWFNNPLTPFVLAGITTLLTMLGYLLSPDAVTATWVVITNRVLSIMALWVVAVAIYLNRKESIANAQSKYNLRSVVDTVI